MILLQVGIFGGQRVGAGAAQFPSIGGANRDALNVVIGDPVAVFAAMILDIKTVGAGETFLPGLE